MNAKCVRWLANGIIGWLMFGVFIYFLLQDFKQGSPSIYWFWGGFLLCDLFLIYATISTSIFIAELWDEREIKKMLWAPTRKEVAAPLKEAEKNNEEKDKKFLEVMAGLGFKNPLADFLQLTKENKVRWERMQDKWSDYVFRAENVVNGIGLECTEDLEIETIPGPAILCRELKFFDAQDRFADRHFNSIAVGGDIREKDQEEKLVDEYAEWLKNKFKNKKPA